MLSLTSAEALPKKKTKKAKAIAEGAAEVAMAEGLEEVEVVVKKPKKKRKVVTEA